MRSVIVLVLLSVPCLSLAAILPESESSASSDMYSLTSELQVLSSLRLKAKSLLSTSLQEGAMAITIIEQDDIERSTARDVTELLDIYVPGLQVFYGHGLSLRGNSSSSGFHYLVMVDGNKVDSKNFVTSNVWRNTLFIENIERIEIIRGALSSVYGSGVLSGAINIITKASQGNQSNVSLKRGMIHNYVTLEAINSKQYDNGNSHFLYFGLSDVEGASSKHAPFKLGYDTYVHGAGDIKAHGDITHNVSNYEKNLSGQLDKIVHAEFYSGPMSYWFKHIQNSRSAGPRDWQLSDVMLEDYAKLGLKKEDFEVYELSSTSAGFRYNQYINDEAQFNFSYQADEFQENIHLLVHIFSFESELAGDFSDVKNRLFHTAFKEQKHLFNASLNYDLNDEHRITLTNEYAFEKYGMDSSLDDRSKDLYFHPTHGAIDRPLRFLEKGISTPWSVHKGSLTAEHAYKPNKRFNLLSSLTYSWHENTEPALIPSVRGVVNFSDHLTGFASLSSAVSSPAESEIRATQLTGGGKVDEFDKTRTFEVGLNHMLSPEDTVQAKVYHNVTDLTGIIYLPDVFEKGGDEASRVTPIGNQKDYGLELEYAKESDRWKLGASYAYQKLRSLDLVEYDDFNFTQYVTSSPYGIGDDFTMIPKHTLKLQGNYRLDDQVYMYGSLHLSTGYDGYKNTLKYLSRNDEDRLSALNSDALTKEKITLNLGVSSQITKKINVSLDAHDVLGWVDDDFNRVHESRRIGYFRIKPASLSLSAEYEFH